MSLILDALKKTEGPSGRKPAAAPPAALASFRFGRPSRSEQIKRIALLAGVGLMVVSAAGYTANFWVKRLRKPTAVLIKAPRPVFPPEPPVTDAPATQNVAAATPLPIPAATPAETPEPAPAPATLPAPAPAQAVQRRSRVARAPVIDVRNADVPPKADPTVQALAAEGPPAQAAPPPAGAPEPAAPPTGAVGVTVASRGPFELAVFYQRSGDYLKAMDQYNKVLEKDPLNAPVYNNLGLLHYATNSVNEAIRSFRQAILIDPRYDKAHNNLGLALRQAGQDAEAEREFERALQLNPKNAEALTNLAAMAKKSGKIERAKIQYLQAIQANPDNAEAHYNLAMLYEEQGESGNAVDHFKKFLAVGSGAHPEVVPEVEKKIRELSRR